MSYSVARLSPTEFSLLAPHLVGIYLRAMDYPREMFAGRVTAWRRAIMEPGFAAVVALTETEDGQRPVGVAYGSLGTHLDWWYANVRYGLLAAGTPTDVLRNYFELTEVHVDPTHQGAGLGRLLVEELAIAAAEAGAQRMLLSTPEVAQEANNAFGLYRRLGFGDILRDITFPGDARLFAILGAPLPLPGARRTA
ncbi:GNAT family N-acetyltransferase [Corynebacterium sp. 13CS0277]|uniref:GNAT family N-acetyltransferase n=1 Tax=Corynebacterium sp. 13CS0277 TaxID=2071994 RepID=UPI000D02B249|nr:GNAT family N-acetyltransferase [Corynebacterium sp. 13CS0277]PRQ11144.1 GNAT family N-acetyltransferase [Corynebacterium sp. 13CS0277]